VAGVPGEAVVAGAEERDVVAATAVDGIVPVTTAQDVRAVATGDRVVAIAAVDRQRGECREPVAGGDHVVARSAVDLQALRLRIDGAWRAENGDPCEHSVRCDAYRVVAGRTGRCGGVRAVAADQPLVE